jgi:hypothetical protein
MRLVHRRPDARSYRSGSRGLTDTRTTQRFGTGFVRRSANRTHLATNDPTTTDSDADADDVPADGVDPTTIHVRCTGHVRTANGEHAFDYTFDDTTPRAFLPPFFAEYDVADLVLAETEAEATAHGLAPTGDDPPGTWIKNPEGEQTRASARIADNGPFDDHLDGLDTPLADGDRVSLLYPFIVCC